MMDTDTQAYIGISLRNMLESATCMKKAKYLTMCLEQHHTFVPLIYLVDDVTSIETHAFERGIASLLSAMWHCMLNPFRGLNSNRPQDVHSQLRQEER